MKFSIKIRDGPARIGELSVDNKNVITPNILFVDTNRFNAPNIADILISKVKTQKGKPTLKISCQFVYPKDLLKELHLLNIKQNKNYYVIAGNKDVIEVALKDNSACIFIVTNAFQLFQQPKNFVDFIIELRDKIGYQKMIYIPSIGNPTNLALLAYMGIDLFDSVSAILAARKEILLFSNGKYNKKELHELPCNCPSCSKFKGKPSDMDFKDILNHNYFAMLNEIKYVRNAIKQGDLRGLVETRVKTDPNLTAIFRNLDTNHYDFLEKRTPITSKSKVLATTKESLLRPEIRRFQKRVIESYEKPNSAKILLLLPCSAKKPYSFSKSHKFFRAKLNSSGNPFVVHELIVTSPMGLVPRELELVHPASSYDIPVTGDWDEDEKKMIRSLLTKYLKLNKYDRIIAHLPKEIMEFVGDILKNTENTCVDNSTSMESLDKLSTVLKKNVSDYDKVKSRDRSREDIQGLASYQFGKKNAEKLLKDCIIKGKYPYKKIMQNNTQLGMITERGLISLTIDGAEKIAKSDNYWVEIYDDFTLKGSVFAPGVKDTDDEIRVGDEVIVIKNNKLFAVGVAQMNGDEMKKSSQGEAVKVRHRI
jgi:archaeosine synthase